MLKDFVAVSWETTHHLIDTDSWLSVVHPLYYEMLRKSFEMFLEFVHQFLMHKNILFLKKVLLKSTFNDYDLV